MWIYTNLGFLQVHSLEVQIPCLNYRCFICYLNSREIEEIILLGYIEHGVALDVW